MRTECIIGITFDRGYDYEKKKYIYGRNSDGLRKPYLFHFPATDGNLIDSKVFGVMFNFCNALAEGDEDPIVLQVVASDKEENLEGWISLHDIMEGNYESFPKYKGELNHGGGHPMYCNLEDLYSGYHPKYIYIRKRKDIHLDIPNDFYYW